MKYIILILVLLTSVSAFALPTCSKNGTRIIYTNGVLATKEKAEYALDKILSLKDSNNIGIAASIDKNGIQDPIVAYNYTERPAKDVLEATVQRLPKNYLRALNVTNAYDGFSRFINGDLIELIPEDIKTSIIESEIQIISSFTQIYFNSELYEKTINEGFPHYLNAIQKKEKILAISHSQGSLFMKDFYDLLPESDYKRKFFAGFQVASVLGNEMNSHFGHATNSKDKVVNSVRFAIGALSANLDTPLIISTSGTSDLFINHGILTTYLYDSSLKEQVIQKLIKAAQLLESNCNKAEIKVIEKKGLKVILDSTDPEDKDVTDLTYEWNFGDELITQTNSKTISHTYTKSGSYLITLKVINNDDDTDTKNIVVQVIAPPKAVINYTKNNLVVNFDSTDSEDPNVTGLTYSWNFGDGKTVNTTSKILSHAYAQAGTYNVSLTVTDSYGASDIASATVIVQGCTNCDTPQIKIFASGATETSSGIFKTPFAGQSTRVSIDVVDLNNDTGTTIFTIRYNEYRYDINTYPFNIFTNTIVNGSSASIPIPFASTSYSISITAYNPISKKTGYATVIFSAVNDSMPLVSTSMYCFQQRDPEGNLVNSGFGNIRIGVKDSDSSFIRIGTWYPTAEGIYEGDFINNAVSSPNGYLYGSKYHEFSERDYLLEEYIANSDHVRVIYQNSDGRGGFVTAVNTCK